MLPISPTTLNLSKPKNCFTTNQISADKNFAGRLEFIPNAVFRRFRSLEVLSLKNVGLKLINRKTFSNANQLKILMLDENQLTSIENQTFAEAANLERLSLSGNLIETVAEDAFAGLQNLKYLKIDFNRIEKLDENLLAPLESLEVLLMNHNRIIAIPLQLITEKNNFKFIDFSFNKIGLLDGAAFVNCHKLETLHLNKNQILKILNPAELENLKKLQILDLSENFCISYLYMFKNLTGFKEDSWLCSENIQEIKQLRISQATARVMEETTSKQPTESFGIVIILIALFVFLTVAVVLFVMRYLKKRSRNSPAPNTRDMQLNLTISKPLPRHNNYENVDFRQKYLNAECDTLNVCRS